MAISNPFAEYVTRYGDLSFEWNAWHGVWVPYWGPIDELVSRASMGFKQIQPPDEAVNTFDSAASRALAVLGATTYGGDAFVAWLDLLRELRWKALRGTNRHFVTPCLWEAGVKFGRPPAQVESELRAGSRLSRLDETLLNDQPYGPRDLDLNGKSDAEYRLIDLALDHAYKESAEFYAYESLAKSHQLAKLASLPGSVTVQHYKKAVRQPSSRAGNDQLETTRQLIRQMRKEGNTHQEICRRLGNHPRPSRAEWRSLTWLQAYMNKRYQPSVKKWLSSACN